MNFSEDINAENLWNPNPFSPYSPSEEGFFMNTNTYECSEFS